MTKGTYDDRQMMIDFIFLKRVDLLACMNSSNAADINISNPHEYTFQIAISLI